jgi:hypothetical protein
MNMSHTKEPWVELPGGRHDPEVIITTQDRIDQSRGEICGMDIEFTGKHGEEQKANARRIVACVNACAGIPTDVLEHAMEFGAAGIQTIESVKKQRDELLAAAKAIEINAEECLDWDDCTAMLVPIDDYHKLMNAIASVKGES